MDNFDLDFNLATEDFDSFTFEESMEKPDNTKENDDSSNDTGSDEAAEAALANAAFMDLATEEDFHEAAESAAEMQDISELFGVAMEKAIVRFDRTARLNHLNKQAQLNLARQNNDPNYKKLVKLWQMERALEAKIAARWGSKARGVANIKIRDYGSNGRKKLSKPNSSTVAYKGKVTNRIAQRAVNQTKSMFSNSNKKTAGK